LLNITNRTKEIQKIENTWRENPWEYKKKAERKIRKRRKKTISSREKGRKNESNGYFSYLNLMIIIFQGEYMEIEAELGSDQEENDDFVKTIDV